MIQEEPVAKIQLSAPLIAHESKALKALEMCRILEEDLAMVHQAADEQELLAVYDHLLKKYTQDNFTSQTFHHFYAPPKLRRLLERLIRTEEVVRIFYGNPYTGENYIEEHDVVGQIGRSSGITKIPLLVPEGENWGAPLLESCLVQILSVQTGNVLWRSTNFVTPQFTITEVQGKFRYEVKHANPAQGPDSTVAAFTTFGKAASYVAFMTGEIYGYLNSLREAR